MSIHPNTVLYATLSPEDLPMKTYRAILESLNIDELDSSFEIKSLGLVHTLFVEDDYDEKFQIVTKPGDTVLLSMVTYGYGERKTWDELVKWKDALEKLAIDLCEQHHCKYKIFVTANYW